MTDPFHASTPAALRLLLVAGLAAGAPALAQDSPAGKAGDWTVAASQDGKGCFLTREYAANGGTTLLLGLDLDGTNRLTVLNPNWSIKPKARMPLDFRLSNGAYPKHAVVGIAASGKRGFVTNFEWRFPGYFAASRHLHIDRGAIPVERLDLAGSGAAVAELRRCVNAVKRTGKAGPAADSPPPGIPEDPFARDLDRRPRP